MGPKATNHLLAELRSIEPEVGPNNPNKEDDGGSSAGACTIRCGVDDGAVRICRRPIQQSRASCDDFVSGSSTLTLNTNHPMLGQGGRGST